ncbi:hypothetical protein BH23PLA1_BH23PLA1_38580 [soil metagenome]
MTWTRERVRCASALLGAGLILGALAWPMLNGRVFVHNDAGQFHLPLRHFYAQCLAKGDDFTWFPYMFCGYYLHGEGQAGMYHPLHLALYSWLPLDVAFNLELLLSYPALLAGVYFLLRRWSIPQDAALLGGLIFALSGFNIYHYINLNTLAVVAHLPWLLLVIDVSVRADCPRQRAWARAGVGILTASQLLLGYPQYVWYSSLAEGLYVLYVLHTWKRGWRPGFGVGVAKGLGVLGGGVQLLPTWEVLRDSVRADPAPEFIRDGSLHPLNLLQHVAPYLYRSRVFCESTTPLTHETFEYGLYCGAAIPVLLVWLLWRWRRLEPVPKRLALGSLMLAGLALVLALGEYTPIQPLSRHLPGMGLFRYPSRHIVLYHLGLAIASAVAFADLARSGSSPLSRRSLWPLAIVPALAILAVVGVKVAAPIWPESLFRDAMAPDGSLLLGIGLVSLATALVALSARGYRGAPMALILFFSADVAGYGLTYLYACPTRDIPTHMALIPVPPEPTEHRVMGAWPFNLVPTMWGLRLVDGYSGLHPKDRAPLTAETTVAADLEYYGWTDANGHQQWARTPDPPGRARLTAFVLAAEDPVEALKRIDLRAEAVVEAELDLPPGEPGSARFVVDRPGKIGIVAEAPARRLLVLAERYHEGWSVRLNRQKAPLLRVNGDFMGCVVPEGRHLLAFEFRPRSLRVGSILSGVGLGLLGIWTAAALRLARRRRPPGSALQVIGVAPVFASVRWRGPAARAR